MEIKGYGGKVLNFWSWNDKITEDELITQMNDFADGRFDGVVIHARAGLEIPYMGEQWFKLYECALRTAKERSLDVWIYDEDGWPSGFAGGIVPAIDPTYYLKRLHYGFDRDAFQKGIPIAAYHKVSENAYVLTDSERAEPDDLFFWYTTEPHYVDLLMPQVVRAFIDCTHENYYKRFSAYFGNTVKGFFTDEPQLSYPLPWSPVLQEKFQARYGVSLLENLWLLAVRGQDYQPFRYRFFSTVSEQLQSSFTAQIGEWCASHNVMMTGHFGTEDGLGMQVAGNSGVMPQYSSMQLPGIDHLGNRLTSPLLCKQVSSVAAQCGTGDALSETFGCCGWDVSFFDLSWIWGRQSALGITTACCHLSAYSMKGIRKRDYPAFFSYQSGWWNQFPYLKNWMSGLSRLMGEGDRLTENLVISPISTVMAEFDGTFHSDRLRDCATEYRCLLQNLLDVQMDFEIGDEQIIRRFGNVCEDRFVIGKRAYSAVFIADCDSLDGCTAALLQQFSDNGGRIFFVNRRPSMVNFEPSDMLQKMKAVDLCNRRELLEKAVKKFGLFRYAILRGREHDDPCGHLIVKTVVSGETKRLQLCNNDRTSGVNGLLEINDTVSVSRYYDMSGKPIPLPAVYDSRKTYLPLSVAASENVVLEFQSGKNATEPEVVTESRLLTPLSICRLDKNCLTIDRARYSINGKLSEPMPVLKITDQIYRQTGHKGALKISLYYTFCINVNCPHSGMSLCFENEPVGAAFVNDRCIQDSPLGWWIDKSIGEYDISELVQPGENIVRLDYSISADGKNVMDNEVFETESNRFFRQIEPESIYIRGNFDVSVTDYENQWYSYSVQDEKFELQAPCAKNDGELTCQGLWFYRGDALLEYHVYKPENCGIRLSVGRLLCPAALWQVGEKSGLIMASGQGCDLTAALTDGDNILYLRLIGSNRNLLGPHHHIKARPPIVGGHTFAGVRSFEDFVSPEITDDSTWTDAYSFVPFSCENVRIDAYRPPQNN